MAKFKFRPEDLRRCLAMARVVKPQTNDICVRIVGDRLIMFSADKRRFVRAEAAADPVDRVPPDFASDDFYITADRMALLDSDLDSVTISVTEKSFTIQAVGDGQSRQAVLKRRAGSSRRPPVPSRLHVDKKLSVNASQLDVLLKQVSCSAQVKETKTEDDMRVNQVHFYGSSGVAVSNARYYGSVAFLPSLNMDFSIVSNDMPVVKSFCSRISGEDVFLSQDQSRLYVEDPSTCSYMALSKISCNRPALSLIDRSEFQSLVLVDQAKFSQCLEWALLALEGTQRLSLKALRDEPSGIAGTMELSTGSTELGRFPVSCPEGQGISADFPAKFLASIIKYVGEGQVAMRFGHKSSPTVMEVSHHLDHDPVVPAYHYLQGMKER